MASVSLVERPRGILGRIAWLYSRRRFGEAGCSWCTDFGYYEGVQRGVDPRKVREVPKWRDSDVSDKRERAALEYAETAIETPAHLREELVAGRLTAPTDGQE